MVPANFEELASSDVLSAFTDDMGFRLRFVSDGGWQSYGPHLDNIILYGSDIDAPIYATNPCDNMNRFILDPQTSGDWWFVSGPDCWTLQDPLLGYIPNDVENILDWTVAIDSAYHAVLVFDIDYDTEPGDDLVYLEIYDGSTWVSPRCWDGIGSEHVSIDITSFINMNIKVRFRVVTDSDIVSDHVTICNLCVHGYVDLEAPTCTGSLSGTLLNGWYSSPVTLTITCQDTVSGVKAIYYKIDGGSTLTYSAPVTISTNGQHFIEYWAVDNVGNEGIHHTTPTFKIDTGSPPTCTLTEPSPGLYLFGNKLLSLSKVVIIGGFTAQATASDADSGVYKVVFKLDGTTFGESTTAPYSAYCGVKHTGSGTLTATAFDMTGQTKEASMSITYFKFL
jgi:hypothetical protein